MDKKILTTLFIGSSILFLALNAAQAGGRAPNQVEITASRELKKYMGHFGTLVAGLEILRAKEKNPDWEVIKTTLREMSQTLQAMQAADKKHAYREFTDQLEKELRQFNRMNESKDPKIYDQFDSLTNACFRCHAAHRPSDLLPSRPIGMQSKLLFRQ